MLDEVLGASDEVVEHILFVGKVPCFVPLFAVFAAAAQVGDRINPTLVQPHAPERTHKAPASC